MISIGLLNLKFLIFRSKIRFEVTRLVLTIISEIEAKFSPKIYIKIYVHIYRFSKTIINCYSTAIKYYCHFFFSLCLSFYIY